MLPTANKWIEIDVDAVVGNLKAVKSIIDEKVRLIAVIKANAYGHGACATAHLLAQQGVQYFAVTFLSEALELRESGLDRSIMLFSPVLSEAEADMALAHNITLTIASRRDAALVKQSCAKTGRTATVHLKVDTGLGRFGLNEEEIVGVWEIIKDHPQISIEGIYTHMAQAASNAAYTEQQYKRFLHMVDLLEQKGANIPVKHCANSAVLLRYPHMIMDAVRVGTLLTGQAPGAIPHNLKLADPYKFKSRIISVRRLKAKSRLGYYSTYTLRHDAQIAVIPVGFQDGLALQVANKPAGFVDMLKHLLKMVLSYFNVARFNLYVGIKGKYYPVRGKVFMQMALVELPLDAEVEVGDEVEVPVRKTIVSPDVARLYIKDGLPVEVTPQKSAAPGAS